MWKKDVLPYAFVAGTAALFSAALFMLLTNAVSGKRALAEMSAQLSYMNLAFKVSSLMTYGSVMSVDAEHRIVVVRMENRYEVGGQPVLLKLTIPSSAMVVGQDLIKSADSGGAYDQLSPMTPMALKDIKPGEHIAVLTDKFGNDWQGYVIIVGNPL